MPCKWRLAMRVGGLRRLIERLWAAFRISSYRFFAKLQDSISPLLPSARLFARQMMRWCGQASTVKKTAGLPCESPIRQYFSSTNWIGPETTVWGHVFPVASHVKEKMSDQFLGIYPDTEAGPWHPELLS